MAIRMTGLHRAMRITGTARMRSHLEDIRLVAVMRSLEGRLAQALGLVTVGLPVVPVISVTVGVGIASAARTMCKACSCKGFWIAFLRKNGREIWERFLSVEFGFCLVRIYPAL